MNFFRILSLVSSLLLSITVFLPAHAYNRVDDGTRDLIKENTLNDRDEAAFWSDIFLGTTVVYPFALAPFDASRVWTSTLLINAESYAMSIGAVVLTKKLVGRERPYGRDCGIPGAEPDPRCSHVDRYRSFISGHSAIAFTGAGLGCFYHLQGSIQVPGWANRAGCIGVMGAATAVALFRVMADRHYLTDVLTGAGVGILASYVFHYYLPEATSVATQATGVSQWKIAYQIPF